MNILSIQSWVAYGHVGNAAAIFPIQRLGHEVWSIHTVQFSNHTGYGQWSGRVFDADLISELVEGVARLGALPTCDGVLSGYMGSAEIGAAIVAAARRVKAANPKALYCCDPVIGDVGRGVFVRPGVPEFMREAAVPAADVIAPNHFELEWLSGAPAPTRAAVLAAVDTLRARGPKQVLVTSVITQETPDDSLDMIAVGPDGTYLIRTPRLPVSLNGAGDAIAALFFTHAMATGSTAEALARAGSSVHGLIARTVASGLRELQIVAAQEEIVAPSRRFTPIPLDGAAGGR